MNKNHPIFVAGHKGMVGSAILKQLRQAGHQNLICRSHSQLDLTQQKQVKSFFQAEQPEVVYMAAARVGGIWDNDQYSAEFIYQNLQIECNVIHFAHLFGVRKLLFLGSSCIYPRLCPQPMQESHLLTGPLERTNEAYAVAKIAGIKLCEHYYRQYGDNFISVMPTNLYGPRDNYDLQNAHVIPALIRKFHTAHIEGREEVEVWGTGNALREFLHVDDMAAACLHVMEHVNAPDLYEEGICHLNVGTGREISISELCELIKTLTQYRGRIIYDTTKPDGTPRKLLDVSLLRRLGWRSGINLKSGLANAYDWYLKHVA